MLDIKFVRENPELVKENIRKKYQDAKLPLVDEVLELDAKNRAAITEASDLRARKNALSKANGPLFGKLKKAEGEEKEALQARINANMAAVKADDERLAELEKLEEDYAAKIHRIMKSMLGIKAMDMKTDQFMIVLPKDGEDLKHEGSVLHHCVGTYAKKVASGETMILFVRRSNHPDVPYFTMEWRDNEIKQLRGRHNCDPPKEVLVFAKAFEKKMREEAEAGCRKNALASTTSQAS